MPDVGNFANKRQHLTSSHLQQGLNGVRWEWVEAQGGDKIWARLGATEEKADKGILQSNTLHSTEVGTKQQFPLQAQSKTLVLWNGHHYCIRLLSGLSNCSDTFLAAVINLPIILITPLLMRAFWLFLLCLILCHLLVLPSKDFCCLSFLLQY